MIRFIPTIAVLVCFALGAPVAARAQEATPAAVADECTVETRDLLPLFREIAGTPEASPEAATADPTPPTGIPADEATVTAVTATVNELVTCVNAGYQFRWLFLFTDEYLRESLAGVVGNVDPADLPAIAAAAEAEMGPATPAVGADQTVVQEIRDVQVLADARVVATVVGGSVGNAQPATPAYFIFVRSGDRFLIDDIIRSQAQATPPA